MEGFVRIRNYIVLMKGEKRPLPFLLAKWGSGARRFKVSNPG